MNRYESLTIALLEGRITRAEEMELSAFLGSDEHACELMRSWEAEWVKSREADRQRSREAEKVEAMWQQFQMRVEEQPKVTIIMPLYRRRAFRWAAAFLLLCSVSYTVLLWHRSAEATAVRESVPAMASTTIGSQDEVKTSVLLPDSSRVTLNEGSVLTYGANFGQTERRVVLEGEAYFEVTKDTGCPFIVNADGVQIRVTGTRFNVSAYAENEQTTVTLLEGGVRVTHPLFNADLTPGEKLIYTRSTKELIKRHCDAEAAIAWMEGKMDFDEVRLEELLTRLSRLYNEPIVMEDTALRNKDVHYYMDERYPLGEVLEALGEVYNLSVAKESGEWKVKVENESGK